MTPIGTISGLLQWRGRSTLGVVLVLVPSVESMEGGRGTVAAHLISARAVALLLVTYFTNCRTRTSSSLTPRVEGESHPVGSGILIKLLDGLQLLPLEGLAQAFKRIDVIELVV